MATSTLMILPGSIDILFVMDDSGSMWDEQDNLARAFTHFLAGISDHSWQVGVTTTDMTSAGAQGRLLPFDNSRARIVDAHTTDALQVIQTNLVAGDMGSAWEEGIGAAVRALTPPLITSADDPNTTEPGDGNLGFLRPNAHLAIVVMADEDDPGDGLVGDAYNSLLAMKGGDSELFSTHGIIALCWTPHERYMELIRLSGGTASDLCQAMVSAASFQTVMQTLGIEVAQRIPERTWGGMAAAPVDLDGDGAVTEADVSVRVNGTAVPSSDAGGGTSWSWDAAASAVVFAAGHAPAPGDTVELDSACAP